MPAISKIDCDDQLFDQQPKIHHVIAVILVTNANTIKHPLINSNMDSFFK